MKNEIDALTYRMATLERENRRLKRFGGVAIGALALTGLVAMAAPNMCDVISAEQLVLRDASGKQRLVLDAYRKDAPTIAWNDKDGRTIARLGLTGDGEAVLQYLDKSGATKASHRFAPEGAARTDASPAGESKPGCPTKPACEPKKSDTPTVVNSQ